MKKIYTLIAVLAITFSASAQFEYDLSIAFAAYAEGSTVDDDPMDGQVVVTNEGPTIPMGDTVFVNYRIDDADYSLDLAAGFVNFVVLEEDMLTGDDFTMGLAELSWAALGISVECCANVYGVGQITFLGDEPYLGDTDVSNNTSCITYNLPEEVDDSGIEDLELVLSNVYVAAGQLMIVNEGVNAENQAELNIINMNGQTVQTENFVISQGTTAVEINNLSAGIYIVAIEVEGAVITRKVSIQ